MKTQIVLPASKGLSSIELSGIAPSHGQTGIYNPRLTFFAPFVARLAAATSPTCVSAENPALPASLEEWLASNQAIEIGGSMTSEPEPVIQS
jgi:hypothetical protein